MGGLRLIGSEFAMTARIRFNWEDAVAQDRDLQRIDTFVKLTISKFPGQPAPPVDTRRGARYESAPPAPAVKPEPLPTTSMGTTTPPVVANGSVNGSSSGGSTPQFINIRDYTSESSSEMDTREVNPMDELSDFESDTSQHQEQQLEPVQPLKAVQEHQEQEEPDVDHSMDVEMEEREEEEEQTACEICNSSQRESEIVLCDDCNAEYHIFCLQPPLPKVPEGAWYCPKCSVKYPAFEVAMKAEQVQTAAADASSGANSATAQAGATPASNHTTVTVTAAPSGIAPTTENGQDNGAGENDPTAIPIIQALEADAEKCNALLIHACNCDNIKCTDLEFHAFCAHMKRFLRSVCWASHSEKWRKYRLAQLTAELFAFHAMNCSTPNCNVPLCVKVREEEIV
ncbi:PHD and RING finger domain-containing protein 1 [Phytophthora citrophthora]|uniref:PHD and RING finger domain-containing protein 1 n=1 Tax=Phytophthora citrophthora TaxID=4793 RepID=A0AAD9GRG9_9STRA|nr:PHD and RING finger domain-containing protein 1 [Phytophthora citrophthora]